MKELTHQGEDDRPDWVPEAVWPAVRDTLVKVKCRVEKRSLENIGEAYGLPWKRLSALLHSGSWRLNLPEHKARLMDRAYMASDMAHDILVDKLQDPVQQEKMSARDASIIAANQADMAQKVEQGHSGNMQVNIGNFVDMKALIANPLPKPEL